MSGFAAALDQPQPPSAPTGYDYSRDTPVVGVAVAQPAADTFHASGLPTLAGFELWVPPKPNTYSDGLPIYEIIGTDAQFVQIPLRAGKKIMCFSGAMAYMSDGMKMEAKFAGFMKTIGRVAGGGSLLQLTYTNETESDGYIALTPDYPGVIVPINMQSCPSGKINALRDSFLCATVGLGENVTEVSAGFNPAQSVAGFCCGGFDFICQTLSNGEWAFIMAMGTVIQKILEPGETIVIDTDSVLCFEASVALDAKVIGSCATCCCAGEGVFITTLTGPGKVWLQSLSIDKMRKLFPPNVESSGGQGTGEAAAGGGAAAVIGAILGSQ